MVRRDRGFTLIEILVVITIIATLAGMVAALAPKLINEGKKTDCQNNLKQIGELLLARNASRSIKPYAGAAFLLQVKDDVKNNQLKVFICPGEPGDATTADRPDKDSQEFADMYRNLELPDGVEGRYTSYAGPEKWHRPNAGPLKHATWLWGCDRCVGGQAYHPDGLCVLFDDASVGFWTIDKLEGHSEEDGVIQVGPESPDSRLKRMQFLPNR